MFAPGLRPLRVVTTTALLLWALAACGCGDGVSRCPVEGTVLLDGAPLHGMTGSVSFVPDRSRGNDSPFGAGGSLDGEGRYTLSSRGKPGVPPGHYKVLVSAVPPGAERDDTRLVVPARYAVERDTPLEVEVVPDPEPGRYDLKVTAR